MSHQNTSVADATDAEGMIIDCDVHQTWKDPQEVIDYLPDHFEYRGLNTAGSMWSNPSGFLRSDAEPDDGGSPGSDPDLMKEQLLDRYDIDYAMLTGSGIEGIGVTPYADYGAALATAYNDWLIDTWLDDDDRFLGSIIVNPQTPERAAEEIHRVGDHPQMKQVLMSSVSRSPYGRKQYWPIYEAAEEEGLPVSMHIGVEGFGMSFPHTAAGYPATYFERHTLMAAAFMGQLTSMVLEGVFVEYPDLRTVFIEGGFAWLPYVLWRMDKNWKGVGQQTPWLDKPPSEYVFEHCRFTTQPIPEPDHDEHLLQLLDMIHAEDTVMFASDYPHWDADDPRFIFPSGMDEAMERAILFENARELYDL
jgi:predicted TIM-barrel fold metal-dependent hydrolase